MRFGELLNKSLKTVWAHKTIWLFGIFFSLFNNGLILKYRPDEAQIRSFIVKAGSTLGSLGGLQLFMLAFLIAVILLLGIFLSFALRGSLIGLVKVVDEGGRIRAGHGFSVGVNKGFLIIGKSLLLWAPFYASLGFLVWLNASFLSRLFSGISNPSGVLVALVIVAVIAAMVLFVAAGIIIAIVNRIADRFIVIEGSRIFASIGQATAMFRKHQGPVFMAWLLMVGITILFLLVFGTYSAMAITITAAAGGKSLLLMLLIAIPTVLIFLIPAGFFEAFGSSFWTYFFILLKDMDAGGHEQEPSGESCSLS